MSERSKKRISMKNKYDSTLSSCVFFSKKRVVIKIIFFAVLLCAKLSFASDFIATMKGIGSSFESFGKSIESMGKGLGMGFGAPPTGYVYSYTVVNDTALPIYVNTQEIASFMGAYFPKAGGWSQATVLPFSQNYNISNKEYYFEMSLHANNNKPTNHLPYVNTDALYIQDCIQLPADKNSTKVNYFRVYMGKELKQGQYVHVPKAEYVGYADPSNPKDSNASVTMGAALTGSPALTIFNNTSTSLTVGYSSKTGQTSLQTSDCDIFLAKTEKNSFVYHSGLVNATTQKSSLPLGTVAVFQKGSGTSSQLFAMPASVFGGKSYTLEIYQDQQNSRAVGLQALMSAHDVPSGRVKDITPVPCVFWYQSVAQLAKSQATGMSDLPGKVWIVSQGENDLISSEVLLGDALQFNLIRPELGKQRWLYFLYINTTDDAKAKQFVQNFILGKNGKDIIKQYQEQGVNQFNQIQTQLANVLTFSSSQSSSSNSGQIVVPESLLQAAIKGALKVNRGEIQDTALGMSGYLLGADVFLPQGLGAASTFYYQLNPSEQTASDVPTSAVINGCIMGIATAPKGMPTPTQYIPAS